MAATSNERVPAELDCTNLATEWPIWKRNFTVYMISSGKSTQEETTKIATFIWLVGTQGATIYNSLFPNDGSTDALLGTQRTTRHVEAVAARAAVAAVAAVPASDGNPARPAQAAQPAIQAVAAHDVEDVTQRTLNDVLKRFDDHCIPQKNVAMESFKFNGIVQKEKQSFAEFETELRTQLRRCDYSCTCGVSYGDRMLRDRIIIGVHDNKLQLKLLDGRDEALPKVIEICKTFEAAHANKGLLNSKPIVASIATPPEPAIHAINVNNNRRKFCFNCGDDWSLKHADICKAKGKSCRVCGKVGHFQTMCRQKLTKNNNNNNGSGSGRNNNNGGSSNVKSSVSSMNWSEHQGESLDNNKSLTRTHSNKIRKLFICRINSVNARWTKEYMLAID